MRLILVMLLLSSPGFASAAPTSHHQLPASAHSHEHGEPAATADELGKRWLADVPLRHAMQQIRSARAHAIQSTGDAVALAAAIDDAIGYMIRNCSLPADADAALHAVIGELAGAASTLRRTEDPRGAIMKIDAALEHYAQIFNESDTR